MRALSANEAAFNDSFRRLFQKFLEENQTEEDARNFFEQFRADQLASLFSAVCTLGSPENHLRDEHMSVNGFFEFIDFATALASSCGHIANQEIQNFPDSPTNEHYIHYVKRYLGEERFMRSIFEKYPYCSPLD